MPTSRPPSAAGEAPPEGVAARTAAPAWWLARLWLVAGVFALIALGRSLQIGIPMRDPGGQWVAHRLMITFGWFVALALLDAIRRTPRGERSPGEVIGTLRRRWPAARLAVAAAVLAAYHLTYFAYHNLKSWNAFRTLRDEGLAQADNWLFLGHSPAVLLHDLLGQGVATYALIGVYESFPTLVSISFVAAVVWADHLRTGAVFVASMVWAWILGTVSYYLLPSLGPFDQSPGDFAGLPHTMVTDTQATYMAERMHLLADPHVHDAFAQIGAFASLHVAISSVIWLSVRAAGYTFWGRVLGVYVALTIVATIFIGWHYVMDDIAGLAIAVLAVRLGRWTIGTPRRRESAPASASA